MDECLYIMNTYLFLEEKGISKNQWGQSLGSSGSDAGRNWLGERESEEQRTKVSQMMSPQQGRI